MLQIKLPTYRKSSGALGEINIVFATNKLPIYRKSTRDLGEIKIFFASFKLPTYCLLYTSPSPRDKRQSRMPSSA